MSGENDQGVTREINGPIVTVRLRGLRNGEQVTIGRPGLVGEVIALEGDDALVQAYESTETLRPGDIVARTGLPLSVELGPGLVGRIFDGVQRPLDKIASRWGDRIPRGVRMPALGRSDRWHFVPREDLVSGARVSGGTVLGTVQETPSINHRILVPPMYSGELIDLAPQGDYTIEENIARIHDETHGRRHKLKLFHRWPVRRARPYRARDDSVAPLITGQRVLDTFFPLLKGGKAAVPGPFGAGKTMLQQQIARWVNADMVIYVGCGERGNELVDVLDSFPDLIDPHTGRKLMERTLLVANTSNMPVVAREASIYVGVTIAEYYRDMGLDVVMLADSTSRWAEALREVSGRLGQMPVEEGYPAYLASRLSAFYERAGRVKTLSDARGSVTLIGAVSPPGGDFSEPVTSHTKDIIQTFWGLSKELADARHYPAIDWVGSFSEHIDTAGKWWSENVNPKWKEHRKRALALLARDAELSRIVNLVGTEALSSAQRWTLEGAALIKEAVLQQSALDAVDAFSSPAKQFALLDLMLSIYDNGSALIDLGVPVQELAALPLLAQARRCKSTYNNDQLDQLARFSDEVHEAMERIRVEYHKQGASAE